MTIELVDTDMSGDGINPCTSLKSRLVRVKVQCMYMYMYLVNACIYVCMGGGGGVVYTVC